MNTDAEGRLILADALALAAKQRPDYMINLATLTGACMVALGTQVAGMFSNHHALAERVMRCAQESGEKLWQLPLVKEYREDIKSSVADIKNIGGGHGGAITAAPPAISNFIVSIDLDGLSDRPPESKVIPLPIRAIFFLALTSGL